MVSEEKIWKIFYLVILPPNLLLTPPKEIKRLMLIILQMNLSLNVPTTIKYSYLQVNLFTYFIEKNIEYSILWSFYSLLFRF